MHKYCYFIFLVFWRQLLITDYQKITLCLGVIFAELFLTRYMNVCKVMTPIRSLSPSFNRFDNNIESILIFDDDELYVRNNRLQCKLDRSSKIVNQMTRTSLRDTPTHFLTNHILLASFLFENKNWNSLIVSRSSRTVIFLFFVWVNKRECVLKSVTFVPFQARVGNPSKKHNTE